MTDQERIEELEQCMSANDELMQKLYQRIAELESFVEKVGALSGHIDSLEIYKEAQQILQRTI